MNRFFPAFRGSLAISFLVLVLGASLTVPLARAAEVTANISGTVTDATSAVVPASKVTLTNTSTNESRSVITGNDGSYQFTRLPIGTYRLTVEQTGFNKYIREGIVLNVNQNAKLDVALQIGSTSQIVEVNRRRHPGRHGQRHPRKRRDPTPHCGPAAGRARCLPAGAFAGGRVSSR